MPPASVMPSPALPPISTENESKGSSLRPGAEGRQAWRARLTRRPNGTYPLGSGVSTWISERRVRPHRQSGAPAAELAATHLSL